MTFGFLFFTALLSPLRQSELCSDIGWKHLFHVWQKEHYLSSVVFWNVWIHIRSVWFIDYFSRIRVSVKKDQNIMWGILWQNTFMSNHMPGNTLDIILIRDDFNGTAWQERSTVCESCIKSAINVHHVPHDFQNLQEVSYFLLLAMSSYIITTICSSGIPFWCTIW